MFSPHNTLDARLLTFTLGDPRIRLQAKPLKREIIVRPGARSRSWRGGLQCLLSSLQTLRPQDNSQPNKQHDQPQTLLCAGTGFSVSQVRT